MAKILDTRELQGNPQWWVQADYKHTLISDLIVLSFLPTIKIAKNVREQRAGASTLLNMYVLYRKNKEEVKQGKQIVNDHLGSQTVFKQI